MPVPIHLENRNLLITGSIDTGKSVAIESLAASILRRRDRMVVTDPDDTPLSKFFLPGDIVLNPFDTRSVGWSIFNEIQSVHNYDRIARSVILSAINAEDEQWCGFARDIFADTLRKLHETEQASVDKLVDFLVREDGEVIKQFLSNTDSSGYFRDNAERATASIQFLMNKYVRPLRRMPEGAFSIYRWLNDPSGGNLYLTWREDMRTEGRQFIEKLNDVGSMADKATIIERFLLHQLQKNNKLTSTLDTSISFIYENYRNVDIMSLARQKNSALFARR
ncbi:type IV secretion system DNA-binding domain-containing protein [Enterobacteriaceae bacterium BIT-l23]|uniref:type IV secretion system DNA-binding domain-containing protein n=1 Tax=Jejubacter sp. L23 TaxID=3092086 RepID=UPI00158528F1|nr:type IV secretion system DNA-binding domain-containing protein [Enterobacteriaceae bacterium BIT-l23]